MIFAVRYDQARDPRIVRYYEAPMEGGGGAPKCPSNRRRLPVGCPNRRRPSSKPLLPPIPPQTAVSDPSGTPEQP